MAGAMSTAEIGLSLAEMIRQDKFSFVCCSANNLEEDIMNLVAHSHYTGFRATATLLLSRSRSCLRTTTTV